MDELHEVSDLFELMAAASSTFAYAPIWWRGQANWDWSLIPPVHRVRDPGTYEQRVTARFKARARSRHSQCPPRGDHAAWLFLMQHYGVPTRLLDWSESPLVGLYFAVRNAAEDDVDGALWVLDPCRLNEVVIGRCGTEDIDDNPARQMFAMVYLGLSAEEGRLRQEAGVDGQSAREVVRALPVPPVIALTPEELDGRMLMQMSAFTIHAWDDPLEGMSECEGFLMKVRVPAAAKSSIRCWLRRLGIQDSYLFPDLEHLATDVRSRPRGVAPPYPGDRRRAPE